MMITLILNTFLLENALICYGKIISYPCGAFMPKIHRKIKMTENAC